MGGCRRLVQGEMRGEDQGRVERPQTRQGRSLRGQGKFSFVPFGVPKDRALPGQPNDNVNTSSISSFPPRSWLSSSSTQPSTNSDGTNKSGSRQRRRPSQVPTKWVRNSGREQTCFCTPRHSTFGSRDPTSDSQHSTTPTPCGDVRSAASGASKRAPRWDVRRCIRTFDPALPPA
ncbi:hypothetical protein FA13DRAFT_318372 [Coprinellus micaceus]|uniref:Uncharacterized protein n=1 Tax=Coprinellus micaceus TaxID=71717 RepID=A0A4Y7TCU8_COPMI|nr:hypothetical protein FA13DRAFT_318372 [Coprinellus micaceus]